MKTKYVFRYYICSLLVFLGFRRTFDATSRKSEGGKLEISTWTTYYWFNVFSFKVRVSDWDEIDVNSLKDYHEWTA